MPLERPEVPLNAQVAMPARPPPEAVRRCRMSPVGRKADVPWAWLELLFLAEAVEEVGADSFCATIVLVG